VTEPDQATAAPPSRPEGGRWPGERRHKAKRKRRVYPVEDRAFELALAAGAEHQQPERQRRVPAPQQHVRPGGDVEQFRSEAPHGERAGGRGQRGPPPRQPGALGRGAGARAAGVRRPPPARARALDPRRGTRAASVSPCGGVHDRRGAARDPHRRARRRADLAHETGNAPAAPDVLGAAVAVHIPAPCGGSQPANCALPSLTVSNESVSNLSAAEIRSCNRSVTRRGATRTCAISPRTSSRPCSWPTSRRRRGPRCSRPTAIQSSVDDYHQRRRPRADGGPGRGRRGGRDTRSQGLRRALPIRPACCDVGAPSPTTPGGWPFRETHARTVFGA
jgi:hypothetical protein